MSADVPPSHLRPHPGTRLLGILPLAALLLLARHSHGQPGNLVISQIFGGGGNSGSPYRHDFVELFNRGPVSIPLTGWSLQYASATSASWQVAPLSNAVAPGGYFLVQLAAGARNGQLLPTPDAAASISISSTAGKVALVQGTTALTDACPTGATIADLVGYGATATCFEGTAPAAAPGNTIALFRASHGCSDANDNRADFFTSAPDPRNASTPAAPCSGTGPLPRRIHAIQGAGNASPIPGQLVVISNALVTALRTNALFLQTRDADADIDPATSEGLLVSLAGVSPPGLIPGDLVTVQGIVQEFRPATDPASPSRTQLASPTFILVSRGNTLPTPIDLPPPSNSDRSSPDTYERFEGMRVRLASLTTCSGTEGFVVEESAIGASRGVFHGVPTGTPRPFREPGASILDPLPAGAPAGIPRFDLNPERLRVDSDAQPGATSLRVTAGATITNWTGVLDYENRAYTFLPDDAPAPVVTGNRTARALPAPGSNELAIASFNLQRFFDPIDDPATDDAVLTATAFTNRLRKVSLAIRQVLRAPDILGVAEVENLATLEAIARRVDADANAAGETPPGYAAHLIPGNDPGGINVGLLVRSPRIVVDELAQIHPDATYLNPLSGQPDLLHDRPSLLARLTAGRGPVQPPLALTVIVNHLRSMSGLDDPIDGPRVRAKRLAQAEDLARAAQALQLSRPGEPLFLVGDFNAFEFNDGLADVLGTLAGHPAPADQVLLAGADVVDPDLVNLLESLPPEERYSYVFEGNAQALDHVLVSAATLPRIARASMARCNADFPETYRSDPTRPERISDHDMPAAHVRLFLPPAWSSISLAATPGPDPGAGPPQLHLEGTGEPGTTLDLESSADLVSWHPLSSLVVPASGRFTIDLDVPPGDTRFHRLRVR